MSGQGHFYIYVKGNFAFVRVLNLFFVNIVMHNTPMCLRKKSILLNDTKPEKTLWKQWRIYCRNIIYHAIQLIDDILYLGPLVFVFLKTFQGYPSAPLNLFTVHIKWGITPCFLQDVPPPLMYLRLFGCKAHIYVA